MPSWEVLRLPALIKNALGIFLTQLVSRAASFEGFRQHKALATTSPRQRGKRPVPIHDPKPAMGSETGPTEKNSNLM